MDEKKRIELETRWTKFARVTRNLTAEQIKDEPGLTELGILRCLRSGDDIYLAAIDMKGVGKPFKVDAVTAFNFGIALMKLVEEIMPGTVNLLPEFAPPPSSRN